MSAPQISDHNKPSDPLADSNSDQYDLLNEILISIGGFPKPMDPRSANQSSNRNYPAPATDYINPKTNTQFLQVSLQNS